METIFTDGQLTKLIETMRQKSMTPERFSSILGSGILADIFDVDADLGSRDAVRVALKLDKVVATSAKSSALKLVNDCVELDAIVAFDPCTLETRPGLWVSPDFVARVRSKAKPVANLGPVTLSSYKLTRNAYNREITPKLGEGCQFDESEACARIAQMVAKQPNGEEGDLLNNGYANLLYLAGCVVVVVWRSGSREWSVNTWKRDYHSYWHAGSQAFSRN